MADKLHHLSGRQVVLQVVILVVIPHIHHVDPKCYLVTLDL
jgi:hypothetical protein